jgi:5'-nucleotidase
MTRKRLRDSGHPLAHVSCSIAACAIVCGADQPRFDTRRAARPPVTGSAPTSNRPSAVAPTRPGLQAPVYEDSDSLALRELVALPTEHATSPIGSYEANRIVRAKLIGFNDFHGSLSTTRKLEGRPVGGAAVLASYVREHSKGFDGRVIIVQAGDFVGASPAVSALFEGEPCIAFFNQLSNGRCDRDGRNQHCNLLGTLGNHEFDQGTTEMLRLVRGGNHAKGPFLGIAYHGQQYPTICANVVDRHSGRTLLPPYVVKDLAGVRVGFIGAVLAGAPWFLKKSGITTVTFEDEVASINHRVNELKQRGVRSIVVVLHQGGRQRFSRDLPRDASNVSGAVADDIAHLDGEVDVVVSGHSHSVLSALLPNREGRPTLLTQAFHSGTAFADIELDIDSTSGEIVGKRARIVSTFADAGPGLTPDPDVLQIVQTAERAAEKTTRVVVGQATATISSAPNEHGESPMGNLVADAQRAALHTDFAFTTPASVRADLGPGAVTWGDLFTIQPFANRLTRVELLGSQVVELLNEQWSVESYFRVLQLSGLAYLWDGRKPVGSRIVEVTVRGKPIEPDKKYRAAINEFLAEGGEGFTVLAKAPRKVSAVVEVEALVDYIKGMKVVELRIEGRIRRVDTRSAP